MQEEVAKHTKKIYHVMKKPGHSYWEKLKEVGIEIFIIVFAVTLSIGLHGWADHRHEQKETYEFLKGLKEDLGNDIRLLEENKQIARRVDSNFFFILGLHDSKAVDTLRNGELASRFFFDMGVTHPHIGRYEGFKSSGKLGTIEDDSLKQSILVYFQQTLPDVSDAEEIANSFQMKIMDLEIGKVDEMPLRVIARTVKMQALLQLGTQNLDGQIKDYVNAQQQAKKIIDRIDRSAER